MISLFISTATKRLILAIIKDNNIIYSLNEYNDNTLSSRIMPEIDKAFKEAQMNVKEIDKIYVVNGPGSFTGIRVGITIAKVMAWSLKKEIYVVSSLELLAAANVETNYIVPLIDARRDYVYTGIYDKNLNLVNKEEHILLDEILEKSKEKDVTYISEDEFSFATVKPQYDILKVINKHKDDKSINPHAVNPNYLKLTEAEEKLNNDN